MSIYSHTPFMTSPHVKMEEGTLTKKKKSNIIANKKNIYSFFTNENCDKNLRW